MRGWKGCGPCPSIPRSASCSTRPRPMRIRCMTRRSEEHTSELQSLMRISYAVFCLTKKKRHLSYNLKLTYTNRHYDSTMRHADTAHSTFYRLQYNQTQSHST